MFLSLIRNIMHIFKYIFNAISHQRQFSTITVVTRMLLIERPSIFCFSGKLVVFILVRDVEFVLILFICLYINRFNILFLFTLQLPD